MYKGGNGDKCWGVPGISDHRPQTLMQGAEVSWAGQLPPLFPVLVELRDLRTGSEVQYLLSHSTGGKVRMRPEDKVEGAPRAKCKAGAG